MSLLNVILLWVVFILPSTGGVVSCASNLPERLIPQAGETGTAMWPQEVIKKEHQSADWMTTQGFDHIVGMLNAVTVYPCERARPATIEIQRMEIIRFQKEGGFVTEAVFGFEGSDNLKLEASQWKRYPEWFRDQVNLNASAIKNTNGLLLLDLRTVPENIIHMWTTPRVEAVPGARYGIMAVVRLTGDARLQFGMDYWKGTDTINNGWSDWCMTSNNCEAWLSDWIGDTNGEFQQVIVPQAFSRSQ